MTEDEVVEWHHQLDGHEFEQALGVGDGQGSLLFCSPWGCKESDTTQQLNNNRVCPRQVLGKNLRHSVEAIKNTHFESKSHSLEQRLGEGSGTPLQYFCLENPMDGGASQAAVHGVTRVGHD